MNKRKADSGHKYKAVCDCLKTQMDILEMITLLEREMVKQDQVDEVGINSHLRSVWGLRDAVNSYFNRMTK